MAAESPLVIRLRDIMEKRQVNARELAERAGVGASFVYDILNGNSRNPTANKLTMVAEALGVSVGWLMNGEDLVAIAPLESGASGIASPWRFHRAWLEQQFGVQPENARAFETRDDAMEPLLQQGDMVLVDITATEPGEGVYAIRDDLGLALRRVEVAAGGKLRLSGDNPRFPAEEHPASAVRILGRVIWSARKFV